MTGLVGWWPLNEDSGTTAYDLSGNGNHGSLNGGITKGVAGKGGLTSYSFDGSDDYVKTPLDGTDVNNLNGGSVSLWVKYDAISQGKYATGSSTIAESDSEFNLGVGNGNNVTAGNLGFTIYDGNRHILDSGFSPNTGTWYHYVITWGSDAGGQHIYVNGKLQNSNADTAEPRDNTDNVAIGCNGHFDATLDDFLDGVIADVRIYNRVLSPQEIQELYEWGKGDYARPLNDQNSSSAVSRWAFDGDATDAWGNNDGTTSGGVSFVNDSLRGQSASFDGTDTHIEVSDSSSLSYGNQVTLSGWVKPDNFAEASPIWDDWKWVSNTNALLFRVNTDSSVGMWVSPDASSSDNIQTNTLLEVGVWQHVVATFDNGEAKLYINGAIDNTKSMSVGSIYNRSYPKSIGEYGPGGNFKGKIDDLRIYSKALSASEVFELYRWGTRGRDMRKLTVNSR